MFIIATSIVLAMIALIGFSYIILRTIIPLAGILILGILVLIPFLWVIHPWFELIIIVLLVVMIIQRQSKEVG